MGGLVDLHCHILPGIDDGAKTVQCAKQLLETSVEKGVTNFVFTPHFYPERMNVRDFIKNRVWAVEQIEDIAGRLGIHFRVGAEIQITPTLASMPLKELAFSGTKYLLLELLPLYEPYDVEGLIHRIRDTGYIPILAHIERFLYIKQDPLLLYQWVKAGALTQVNAEWVIKNRRARKRLKQYYHWNLVHIMSSDMHSATKRPQNLIDGYNMLPPEMAADFQLNAKTIFEGNIVKARHPVRPKHYRQFWK